MSNPAEASASHGGHVSHKSLSQISGVNVQLEDGKDLVKQLLLMQIVKLKGGVHSVDDGMLVHKSWESGNNLLDEASGVREIVHNMSARNHVVSAVHAVVEMSNTIGVMVFLDIDKVMRVSGLDGMGGLNSLVILLLGLNGLDCSESR